MTKSYCYEKLFSHILDVTARAWLLLCPFIIVGFFSFIATKFRNSFQSTIIKLYADGIA